MAANSEPDLFGIKWKKSKRSPKDSADEKKQPDRNANDDQRPPPVLLQLKALEPLPFDPLKMIYEMGGEKLMLVFNHTEYENDSHSYRKYKNGIPPRKYTDRDVRRLQEVFGNELDFHIDVHQDKNKDFIYKTVDNLSTLSKEDHSKTSCVCVVVMTHGDKNGELLASDQPYQLEELVSKLQVGNLAGKPKLFIVQACRGVKVDEGFQLDGSGHSAAKKKISTHADTLVFRSSVEGTLTSELLAESLEDGNQSDFDESDLEQRLMELVIRDGETISTDGFISWKDEDGSWLIQELCRVVYFTHRDLEFLQMTTMVTASIANKSGVNVMETPEVRSTLTKLLRF